MVSEVVAAWRSLVGTMRSAAQSTWSNFCAYARTRAPGLQPVWKLLQYALVRAREWEARDPGGRTPAPSYKKATGRRDVQFVR